MDVGLCMSILFLVPQVQERRCIAQSLEPPDLEDWPRHWPYLCHWLWASALGPGPRAWPRDVAQGATHQV